MKAYERSKTKNMINDIQHEKYCIMISGGIWYGGRTDLEVLDVGDIKINSEVYLETVKRIYEPDLIKHKLIFQ
jgi:hypothetical protein